jgi:hypothetical protein
MILLITKFLNADQRSDILRAADVSTLEQLCAVLPTAITAVGLADFLVTELESTRFQIQQHFS